MQRKKKLITKKKFRLGEFIAEKTITATAFISFTFIVLIFVFVFREALPIFSSQNEKPAQVNVKEESQETYGDDQMSDADKAVEQKNRDKANDASEGDAT